MSTLTQLEAADFINRSFKPLPRAYGDALVEAALNDPRIVALCADLVPPTETDRFRDELPERYHNVGIAEANMIGMAGGMARSGEIPFCHSFCAFITKRVLDQITMQAAYPNLPVKIVGFLPGVATLLGVSHQAIEDVAIMRAVPNMAIFEPSGPEYHAAMVQLALDWDGPAYLRMKRPETTPAEFEPPSLQVGKGVIQREGGDLTIIAAGLCVAEAVMAAEALASEGVEARADELAEAGTLEQGKLLRESKGEALKCCAEGRFSVGEAARMGAMAIASGRAGFSNQILRRPRGVIFCISPWNFPISTPMRKICPALAFGNAVVMKPSQFTPAANFLLAEIARDVFPENLIQVAMVSGRVASEAIASGDIHGVSFTGSVPTGKLVYKAAAENLIPAQLELGGKNAAILNDSDNIEGAIGQILGAAFMTSSQRCTAISRVIVHKDSAKKAKDILSAKAAAMKVGPGMDASTDIGPLCNQPHWQDVCDVTAKAIAEGAKPLTGGSAPGAAEAGYFYTPTILDEVQHQSIAGQQEIFGPVLSVLDYETFDQAMEMLNGTEFGLTSALFSNRNDLIQRFLAESQNGMIHVNHGTVPDNNMPFGGIKNSGVGAYSVGPTAVNFCTSEHSAYIAC